MPGPDTFRHRSRAYASYLSQHYETHNARIFNDRPRMVQTITQQIGHHLPRDKRAHILDVGAGVGLMVRGFHDLGYANAEGVDLSSEQVLKAETLGIPVVCADAIEYLQSHASQFDLITAFDLLEHFSRDEGIDFLAHAAQALRPGGRIIIRTINANGPFAGRSRWRDITHETSFTGESLHMTFHLAGLQTQAIYGRDGSGTNIYGLIHRAVRGAYRIFWRGYAIAEWGVAEGRSFPLDLNILGVAQKTDC